MAGGNLNKFWAAVTILLVVAIVIGGIVIWSKFSPSQPIEISLPKPAEWQGSIYIDGAVVSPGLYPLQDGDSIKTLISAAGGAADNANLNGLELYVPFVNSERGQQKIDINRAESWLLEALPGIGETLAQHIVDYRQQNGLFNTTAELLKVPGIGSTTYERIKDLITVSDR